MKNILSFVIVLVFSVIFSGQLFAQTTIAYVDAEAVIQLMPEWKKAKSDVQAMSKTLETNLKTEEQKLIVYVQEIRAKDSLGTLTPVQLKEAQQKIGTMRAELQKKAKDAQKQLADEETKLLKPVYDKFNQSLETVATANKYNYISDKKLFIYMEDGIDATDKVKAALGL